MLRAGLTEVFRYWDADKVDEGQPQADGNRSKPSRYVMVCGPKDDQEEHVGEDKFGNEC